jgi:hypothetical protein
MTTTNNNNNTATTTNDSKNCLIELIKGYNQLLRQQLFPYLYSKEYYLKIKGQTVKTGLLKILLEFNHCLNDSIQPILSLLGLKCRPKLFLKESEQVSEVVEWYSMALIQETKIWLSNTLKYVYKNKSNKFDLPWDILNHNNKFELGKYLLSDLPETLMSTLQVYLDLCISDIDVNSLNNNNNNNNYSNNMDNNETLEMNNNNNNNNNSGGIHSSSGGSSNYTNRLINTNNNNISSSNNIINNKTMFIAKTKSWENLTSLGR